MRISIWAMPDYYKDVGSWEVCPYDNEVEADHPKSTITPYN